MRCVHHILGRINFLTRQSTEFFRNQSDILRLGIQAGAHSGGAHIHRMQRLYRSLDSLQRPSDGLGISMKFLAQGDRHGILKMGPAHFQHLGKLRSLRFKGLGQGNQRFHQFLCLADSANANRRRNHVIGGLRHIDMIVRRNQRIVSLRFSQNFQSTVSDHLVGVHVHGGAGAALDAVHHELVLPLPGNDFLRGFHNRMTDAHRHPPGPHIGPRRRRLHNPQSDNKILIQHVTGNQKVMQGPCSLHAIVELIRNFNLAEKIFFNPHSSSPLHSYI